MAAQVIVEGEYQSSDDQLDPDLNSAFFDFIDQVKSEANSTGSIAVFEVPVDASGVARPNTLRKPKLFTVPVGTMTVDDICDRVLREFVEPGGSIMIQLLGRKAGQRGNLLNIMIPLRRGKIVEDRTKSDGSTTGDVAQLMRMMNEQRARDLAEMRELIAGSRPQVDPLNQGLAIAKEITAMTVAARGGVVPGAVATANDPNAMMNQMMAIMMTSMMKKFMAGMDGGERKEESADWMKTIADLAKPLLEAKATAEKTQLVTAQRMLRHEVQAPSVQVPPASAATADDQPTLKEQNEMKLLALLNSAIPMIIDGVVLKDGDAVATAKLLMDELPEDDAGLNDALYQLIQSPPLEFIEKISLADKRAKDHAPWFEQLRVALLAAFDPDQRTPDTSGKPA